MIQKNKNENEFEICAICFMLIKKKTQEKKLDCHAEHSFHQRCIWKWIVKNNSCPTCRQPVNKYPSYPCNYNEHHFYLDALVSK